MGGNVKRSVVFAGLVFALCVGLLRTPPIFGQEAALYPNVLSAESGVLLPMGRLSELKRIGFSGGIQNK